MPDLNRQITVVIPTLNEENAIGKVIEEVKQQGITNILVVDGYSTDRTVKIAREKGAKVIMQEGKGKADAIKTAVKHVNTPYMLVMDGDWTYPAKHIKQLYIKALKDGLDIVIGARNKDNMPLSYKVGNWILTKFFNILFGCKLKDVLSGMYLAKTDTLKAMLFDTKGFSIESEIAAHISSTTGKIGEIPIEYRERIGKKKLGRKHGLKIAKDMIKLAWSYNPTFTIYATASLLLIPGLAIGTWVAYHYFFTGIKYYIKGLIAIILATTGFQSLQLAILALYLKRLEQRMNRSIKEIKK